MTAWVYVIVLCQCAANFCAVMWMRATAKRQNLAFEMLKREREAVTALCTAVEKQGPLFDELAKLLEERERARHEGRGRA